MKLRVILKRSTGWVNFDGLQVNAKGVSEGSLGLEEPQEFERCKMPTLKGLRKRGKMCQS